MNSRKLVLMVLAILLLSACQLTQSKDQPQEMPKAPADGAYPAPAMQGSPDSLYPTYFDGSRISWASARALILNNEVSKITVAQTLQTTLFLKDGRTLISLQPAEGELQTILQECGDVCKDIEVVNE